MKIKSIISPIGNFNAIYIDSLLAKLDFLDANDSIYPQDRSLQKSVDKFFSINEGQQFSKFNLQGTSFQLKVWKALMEIPRGHTESDGSLAAKTGERGAAGAAGAARASPGGGAWTAAWAAAWSLPAAVRTTRHQPLRTHCAAKPALVVGEYSFGFTAAFAHCSRSPVVRSALRGAI